MKKIRKNKKDNSYFLGGLIDQATGQLSKLGNMISSVTDTSNGLIPSSGNAKTDAITGGIATGLESVGSAFGPIGSVVGKAAGMLTKGIGAIVGTSDSVNTDTGEYIEGKGIKGRRSENRVRAQWRRVNQGIADADATAAAQEEWTNTYGDNTYSLAEYGGVLPTTLAYLDDGELMRTPDGEISQIPEQGKSTDSNLVNVPVGTQVLSDKLKVPGTNKTFAQVGKKYMKTGKKKGNDIYAQNSQMLNDRNNQKKYNELLALQEQIKTKRGIKNKVGKYAKGTLRIPTNVNNMPEYTGALSRKNIGTFGKPYVSKPEASSSNNGNNWWDNIVDIIPNGAALIGPMANIYNSDPEKTRVFTYSPHFVPVDYDISPILREINMTNAIARYNANQTGGFGRSANLAQAVQSQVVRNRSIAQAYNQKNNIENERKARNIGIYNDWARYNTEAYHRGYEEDAQNRAAARTIRNTGLSQLGTALQSMARDNRLSSRDQAMLEYMRDFFNYGSTQDAVSKLYRNFR